MSVIKLEQQSGRFQNLWSKKKQSLRKMNGNKLSVAKILVMGSNDDKAAIIRRYVNKTFNDKQSKQSASIGVATKHVRVNDEILKLQLWDIANQRRFVGLAENYYRYACAAIIVFDITKKESLSNALKWKSDLDKKIRLKNGNKIPVILVANKYDLVEQNEMKSQFTDTELDGICSSNHFIAWFSTSAKTGLNVRKCFNFIIRKIVQNKHKMDRMSSPKHDEEKSITPRLSTPRTPTPRKGRSYTLDGLLSYFATNKNEQNEKNDDDTVDHDGFIMHHA